MIKLIINLLLFAELFSESPGSEAKKEVIKFYKSYLQPKGFLNIRPGGCLMGGIHQIDVNCEKQELVSIEKARCYIVNNVENFLFFINKTKATKYFDSFPMTELQLYFSIGFITNNFKIVKDDIHVSVALQSKGKIQYYYRRPLGIQDELIFSETYAEAYEKVYGLSINQRQWMKEYK